MSNIYRVRREDGADSWSFLELLESNGLMLTIGDCYLRDALKCDGEDGKKFERVRLEARLDCDPMYTIDYEPGANLYTLGKRETDETTACIFKAGDPLPAEKLSDLEKELVYWVEYLDHLVRDEIFEWEEFDEADVRVVEPNDLDFDGATPLESCGQFLTVDDAFDAALQRAQDLKASSVKIVVED